MRKLFDAQVQSGPRGCLCLGEPEQAIYQPHHLERNGAFAGLGLQAGCVKLEYLFSANFSYYLTGSVNGDTLQMGCVKAKFYLDGVYPTAEDEQEEADKEEEEDNDLPSPSIKLAACSGVFPDGQQLVESEPEEESQSLLA